VHIRIDENHLQRKKIFHSMHSDQSFEVSFLAQKNEKSKPKIEESKYNPTTAERRSVTEQAERIVEAEASKLYPLWTFFTLFSLFILFAALFLAFTASAYTTNRQAGGRDIGLKRKTSSCTFLHGLSFIWIKYK
jgi:hypothetical protein